MMTHQTATGPTASERAASERAASERAASERAAAERAASGADEATAWLAKHPDTREVDAFLIDLNGKAFGKRLPVADLPGLYAEGTTMCAAMQLTDAQGTCWDTAGLGFSDGDPDAPCRPVPGTLAPVPWSTEPRAQCLMRFEEPDGALLWYEPRTILGAVVDRFAGLGLTPVVALELEFYLVDTARAEDGAPQPPRSPVTGRASAAGNVFGMAALDEFAPVLDAILSACRAQGLPVTAISKEYGPGQFEINLGHRADALRAADEAALLRRAVTAAARVAGYDATFMSKPYAEGSGSGCQVNLSLADATGGNAFAGPEGARLIRHAVAGMQAMLPETMAVFAPNLHAYRRFAPDQFTPVTLDWGENNRSVAFRVPAGDGPGRRIEHRAGGAEANPYLVTAAALAAAHHGIARRLEPTEPATGNAGAALDPTVPVTLWSALDAMQRAAVLPDYFGQRYVDAYVHAKRSEFDAFMAAILPREYEWYL